MSGTGENNSSSEGSYSHIESLLRALHQPNVNVSRPAEVSRLATLSSISANVLGNIEELSEETLRSSDDPIPRSTLPVLFDIESVSETSSNKPSPAPSAIDLESLNRKHKIDNQRKTEATSLPMSPSPPSRILEDNLERFNKNVLNVMDSIMKSRTQSPLPLTSSASTGKPFVFYHRMHRHNSAHSLNIPNIVVTGSADPQSAHHHHHKRFSFGLRRHSHAVVG